MPTNHEIARKMDELMFHYRRRNNFRLASIFSDAGTEIRQMDKPVEDMPGEQLSSLEGLEQEAVEAVLEFVNRQKLERQD